MCRWMAWSGQDVIIDELLFKTRHGLIDQSLHSGMGAETTNGDGFGLGWYGVGDGPGVYRSVAPAWGDANLRHLARLREGDRLIVSEPFSDLPGAWHEIPESTAVVVAGGTLEQRPFAPVAA